MLSNHLKATYTNNYHHKSIRSSIKVDVSQSFENNQNQNHRQSNQNTYNKSNLFSTQEKVSKLNEVVNNQSLINTLILKTKLSNISHY